MVFRLLLVLIFSPFVVSATEVITYPTSANNANITFTPAGKAKIEAVAKQQALASALLYKNSSIKDAFIKVKLFYKGMETQVYHRISNYLGPSGQSSWPLDFSQSGSDCGGTCYKVQNRWTSTPGLASFARNTSVVSYSYPGTCVVDFTQGATWNSVPVNHYVCGKRMLSIEWNQWNTSYCTPYGISNGEMVSSLWCPLSISFYDGPLLEMTLPGAWILSKGVGAADLSAGMKYPEPDGVTASVPPPGELIDTTPYEDYIEKGGIVLEDTDITTFTITGASGDDSTEGGTDTIITNIISSVSVNVEVNVSTAEIVERLDLVNDNLTALTTGLLSVPSTATFATDYETALGTQATTNLLKSMVDDLYVSVTSNSYTNALNQFIPPDSGTPDWEPCFDFAWTAWGAAPQSVCLSQWPGWNSSVLPLMRWTFFFLTALWSFIYMWKD